MTHAQLRNAVLVAVSASGLAKVWPQNTGVATRGGRVVRFGVVGGGDISGIMCVDGRRLEIEIKTGAGRQSKEQRNFEAMIRSCHGIYLVARDADNLLAELRTA